MGIPVQAESDHSGLPFFTGRGVYENGATLVQDAGRTTPLAPFTLMTKSPSTRKWSPMAAEATELPMGIYIGEAVTAAALVAGDVTGADILIAGPVFFDVNQLVLESGITMNDVLTLGSMNVSDWLIGRGLIPRPGVAIDANV